MSNMETMQETVGKALDNIAERREQFQAAQEGAEKPEFKEITIKFSGKLVSEPFTAKDGKEYVSIKIPNRDENDKSPWASFVLPAKRVQPDKFGKGMWAKIPENGSTTIRKDKVVGQDENGKRIYETEKTRVPNKYLKGMVEFYKGRGKDKAEEIGDGGAAAAPAALSADRPSLKDRLAEKKSNVEQMIKVTGPKSMQRPKEAAL